jgi:hypothetical protein
MSQKYVMQNAHSTTFRYRLVIFMVILTETHVKGIANQDLAHAQASKPERESLRFTGEGGLATQHGLDLPGRRDKLVGLAHRELLARLGLDMIDEPRQVAAGLRRIVGRQVRLHRL